MITITVLGGLGNQMFQYAAAKALACKHGVDLAIDESAFRSYELRGFLLDRLRVPEAVRPITGKSSDKSVRLSNFRAMRWRNRADRSLKRLGVARLPQSPTSYSERHFHFDPEFFSLGGSISLFGYFQSERYFAGIADKLRDHFRPREVLGPQAQAVAEHIARSRMPVSVHIRRGDYVKSNSTAQVHGSMGVAYYKKALQLIEGLLDTQATLFVFSDDPADAESILDFVPSEHLVHVRGEPERPWEDMTLMAQCRHHIIANSSFSWWGAWLNPSVDKIVIAPRNWFTPGELRQRNVCDLHPPEWILI